MLKIFFLHCINTGVTEGGCKAGTGPGCARVCAAPLWNIIWGYKEIVETATAPLHSQTHTHKDKHTQTQSTLSKSTICIITLMFLRGSCVSQPLGCFLHVLSIHVQ